MSAIAAMNVMNRRLRDGGTVLGAWLFYREPLIALAASKLGYDFVCIDMQHGLQGFPEASEMVMAVLLGGATPIVRVPSNEEGIICRMLDAGAMGIIVPMISTREDAERAVRSCLYPPEGARSIGALSVSTVFGEEYFEVANENVLAIPMIETSQAIDNIDSIVSIGNVQQVFVGPYDLSTSLKCDMDSHQFRDALDTVVESCRRHGKIAGIYSSPELVAARYTEGFQLVSVCTDFDIVTEGLSSALKTARTAVTS